MISNIYEHMYTTNPPVKDKFIYIVSYKNVCFMGTRSQGLSEIAQVVRQCLYTSLEDISLGPSGHDFLKLLGKGQGGSPYSAPTTNPWTSAVQGASTGIGMYNAWKKNQEQQPSGMLTTDSTNTPWGQRSTS